MLGSLGAFSAPSDLAALSDVRRFIDTVADEARLSGEQTFNLKVAVSEACANAIEHATRRPGTVDVKARLEGHRLTVSVVGHSDFQYHPGVEADERRHRGFGLPLMVALTDEVRISRHDPGGVRVELSLCLEESRSSCAG